MTMTRANGERSDRARLGPLLALVAIAIDPNNGRACAGRRGRTVRADLGGSRLLHRGHLSSESDCVALLWVAQKRADRVARPWLDVLRDYSAVNANNDRAKEVRELPVGRRRGQARPVESALEAAARAGRGVRERPARGPLSARRALGRQHGQAQGPHDPRALRGLDREHVLRSAGCAAVTAARQRWLAPGVHERVEGRQREQREQRRGDQAADHHDRERALDLGAVQPQTSSGSRPEDRGGRGHQLGAHAADAGLAQRLVEAAGPRRPGARVCVTSTRPFCTAMPNRPISPTSDETFQVSPAMQQREDAADEGVGQRREDDERLGDASRARGRAGRTPAAARRRCDSSSERVARAWLSTRPPTSTK